MEHTLAAQGVDDVAGNPDAAAGAKLSAAAGLDVDVDSSVSAVLVRSLLSAMHQGSCSGPSASNECSLHS